MNKWIKFPLIFGIIGAMLGIFFHPIKILNINLAPQSLTAIFSLAGIIDGFILGIIIGLIIALFVKRKPY